MVQTGEYMRNWAAPQSMESRISGLLEKNLFLPTDTFIASLAQKHGMPYTKGKKGDVYKRQAKDLKAALDTFAQGGKKPTEVAKQITDLTAQVNKGTKQLDAMNKTCLLYTSIHVTNKTAKYNVGWYRETSPLSSKEDRGFFLPALAWHRVKSVSYTHLDVYKRQYRSLPL